MAWNSLPDFIRDPTSSTDCFRRLYLKRTCSRIASASSALWVLTTMRYINRLFTYLLTYLLTHSLTHSLTHLNPTLCTPTDRRESRWSVVGQSSGHSCPLDCRTLVGAQSQCMCGLDLGHYACACPPGAHVEDLTCTGNGMLIGDDRVNGVHSGNGNPVGM